MADCLVFMACDDACGGLADGERCSRGSVLGPDTSVTAAEAMARRSDCSFLAIPRIVLLTKSGGILGKSRRDSGAPSAVQTLALSESDQIFSADWKCPSISSRIIT